MNDLENYFIKAIHDKHHRIEILRNLYSSFQEFFIPKIIKITAKANLCTFTVEIPVLSAINSIKQISDKIEEPKSLSIQNILLTATEALFIFSDKIDCMNNKTNISAVTSILDKQYSIIPQKDNAVLIIKDLIEAVQFKLLITRNTELIITDKEIKEKYNTYLEKAINDSVNIVTLSITIPY